LHCFNHWAPPNKLDKESTSKLVVEYVSRFKAFIEELCPSAHVTLECSSVDNDFATMVKAPKFIGSASSMSRFAALLRTDPCVCPQPQPLYFRKGDQIVSSNIHELSHEEYVLDHKNVPDYGDIEHVLKLLAS
jgi:hypothetical protein